MGIEKSLPKTATFTPPEGKKVLLRENSTDEKVYHQIFEPGWEYDHALQLIKDAHPEFDPKVIVDVGGNCGLAGVYFKYKYPDSHLVAIEPDQENFDMILKQAVLTKDQVVFGGVWNRNAHLELNNTWPKWAI